MTSRAMTIRLAELRDAQAIGFMSRDLIESGLGWKYDAERILRAMRQRETVVLVACERGLIVGFAVMEFGDERAHLVLLAVRPAHRRRGIGRGLLDWLLASARAAGMESVHLELRAGNEAARGFYRALGFSETLLVPGYYRGREAALRMLRLLRAPGATPFTWRPPALDQS
ncbi:MAG TPA: GNAT family N-acetyltransferase [Burkholderiales bacterium]|nr:GNAT family N-acetyltransferase [Burkholderiales bacterium]